MLPMTTVASAGAYLLSILVELGPRHNDFRWRSVAPRRAAGSLTRRQSRLRANPHRHTRRSTLSHSRTRCIGLDVHKNAIAGADVAPDHGAEVMDLGAIGTRPCDLDPPIRTRPAQATPLLVVSAAGPCGSRLYRDLPTPGDDGWVVAPSLMPNKAGDRLNTDRRDAMPWARLARSGDLTPVSVPTVEEDALRHLTRARAEPRSALTAAKCRLHACWRRHESRDIGRATWIPAQLRWRAEGVCPTPAQPLVLHADVRAVTEHTARLPRLEQARHARVTAWRVRPVLAALQAVRGVPCPVAVTLVAERGDLTRFAHPSALMKCWGLLPAASSTGERRRPGAMTTADNTQARRARVEGAWA
jgi:transposase